MAQELTQARLKELLHYDPETGVFTWRQDVRRTNIKAGAAAGHTPSHGYHFVRVDGVSYLMHRLAWLYVYGEMPEGKVDHHDRDKGNNRISNLRPATTSQNGLNRGVQSNNTSGHKGVSWHKPLQRWMARITVSQKRHFLGCFDNILDAVAARKAAEITLGVSEFCPQL